MAKVIINFIDFIVVINENRVSEKISLGVLVGAFSDFGQLDTGNPVQIWGIFDNFTLFLFPEGLI